MSFAPGPVRGVTVTTGSSNAEFGVSIFFDSVSAQSSPNVGYERIAPPREWVVRQLGCDAAGYNVRGRLSRGYAAGIREGM